LPTEVTSRFSNTVLIIISNQGSQQTLKALEDPENPGLSLPLEHYPGKSWIFFVPGKIPWNTLILQPFPEKLFSEADPCKKYLALRYCCGFDLG